MKKLLSLITLLFVLSIAAHARGGGHSRGGAGGEYGRSNPAKTVSVNGYFRSNGTFVHGYNRRPSGMGSDRELAREGLDTFGNPRASRGGFGTDYSSGGSVSEYGAQPSAAGGASQNGGYHTEQDRAEAAAQYEVAAFGSTPPPSAYVLPAVSNAPSSDRRLIVEDATAAQPVNGVAGSDTVASTGELANTGGSPWVIGFAGLMVMGLGLGAKSALRP